MIQIYWTLENQEVNTVLELTHWTFPPIWVSELMIPSQWVSKCFAVHKFIVPRQVQRRRRFQCWIEWTVFCYSGKLGVVSQSVSRVSPERLLQKPLVLTVIITVGYFFLLFFFCGAWATGRFINLYVLFGIGRQDRSSHGWRVPLGCFFWLAMCKNVRK